MCGCLARISFAASEALVGVRRRHSYVDKRDVGLIRPDLEQQIGGGAAPAHDLETVVLQQARDSLAQQHRVVSDDDASAVGDRRLVGPGRWMGQFVHVETSREASRVLRPRAHTQVDSSTA